MSKRFRDTGIWKKEWYRKLTPEQKCAWTYLCDECDNVGVIRLDREAADFVIGAAVDWEALLSATNGNIIALSDGKWFLVDFCDFQYGELKEASKPHASYLSLLRKHGLEGYPKSIHTLKEKDKEKEKDKDKERQGYAEGVAMTKEEHSALVGQYGERVVTLAIEKVAAQQIKTGKKYKSPRGAVLQWGIRAALEELKKQPMDRSPPAKPKCVKCSKELVRDHGYFTCSEHGRQEE